MSDEDRRAVAYHEPGDGLVAMALPGGRVLHRLSIIARGRSLGAACLPESDEHYTSSRSLLMERMATFCSADARLRNSYSASPATEQAATCPRSPISPVAWSPRWA